MIAELRDWLRTRPALSGISVALRGDTIDNTLPRVRLFVVADPREHDLDGQALLRDKRIQIDVYAQKSQAASSLAETIEDDLENLIGSSLGSFTVSDIEYYGVLDGSPDPSPSGNNDPINHAVLDFSLMGDVS